MSCLHIFRHLAQFVLARRQPCFVLIVQSDEKSDCAIHAQSLCGIALGKSAKNCPGRFARGIEFEVSPLSVLVLILAVLTLTVLVLAVLLILLVSVLVLVVLILIVLVILVGHCFSS